MIPTNPNPATGHVPEPVTGRDRHSGNLRHSKPPARAWDEALARVPAFAARVQPLYVALDWQWGWVRQAVPTAEEIERGLANLIAHVRRAVEAAPDSDWLGRWAGTGGLRVTCGLDVLGFVAITLAFAFEDEVCA